MGSESTVTPGLYPPGWTKFLLKALPQVTKAADRKYARELIKSQQFLDAAEIITECSDHADFGNYLRSTFIEPRFAPSQIHRLVLEMDPKIVITTNYDQIYDQYCNSGIAAPGYNVAKYSDDFVVENIRSRIRLIIKAHGCVSGAQQIVLSRSSYYRARRDYPGFYQVLDALFLTNTLLFIGCSLTDPDIQLVLENANLSTPSAHPHYALVEKTRHNALKLATKTAHNIELIEYPVGEHKLATEALGHLRDKVNLIRAATV
jgi:hypothetical protein